MKIGEKITAMRVAKNITVLRFSEQLSISVSQLLKWEDGIEIPNNFEIQRIALELGVKYDDFISGVDIFTKENSNATSTSSSTQDVKSNNETSNKSYSRPKEERAEESNIPHNINELFSTPILPRALNEKYIPFIWIFRVVLTLISSFFAMIALVKVLSDYGIVSSNGLIYSVFSVIVFSLFLIYSLKKMKTDLRPMVVYLALSVLSIGIKIIFSSLNFVSVIMYILIIINDILLVLYIIRQGEYSLIINRLCQIILGIALISALISFANIVILFFQTTIFSSILIHNMIAVFTLIFASIGDFFLAKTLTEEHTNIWKAKQ